MLLSYKHLYFMRVGVGAAGFDEPPPKKKVKAVVILKMQFLVVGIFLW